MMIVEITLLSIAIILLLPVAVIFIQVLLACLPAKRESVLPAINTRVAVLIPAHDEGEGIVATIDSILPQLKLGDRLLVVADNCTDATAAIAKERGAEVIERHDPDNRGKGFALDFGMQFLALNPPDVVVIVDADCIVQKDALNKLVAYSVQHRRPVQCLYLMQSEAEASLKTKITEFAWIVKNKVRPSGYNNIGLPCQLMGSGMAFPWASLVNVNLANGNIVEDLKLGIDLAKTGNAPLFYADALVTSYFPSSSNAQSTQRTRWEHGHLSMILTQMPPLLLQGLIQGNKNLLAMALDLCVPPLALLVMMLAGLFTVTSFVYLAGYSFVPLLVAGCLLIVLATTVLLAWWGWGRRIVSLYTLLLIPFYVISKIPNYFKFIFNRQKKWVRTARK